MPIDYLKKAIEAVEDQKTGDAFAHACATIAIAQRLGAINKKLDALLKK